MTEMSEYKNNNNNNKSRGSKKRKDSKMSLTALYNIRHTPSIPLYDNQNELDNDFKQIDAIQPIKQQRTQSLSVKIVKSNSKKMILDGINQQIFKKQILFQNFKI
eukprot:462090_1